MHGMVSTNKIYYGPIQDKYLNGYTQINKVNHILSTHKLIDTHADEIN